MTTVTPPDDDLPETGAWIARARAEALVGWQPDPVWRGRFTDLAAATDVVSFDVFDTALTRIVETPVDVFAVIERELVARQGRIAQGYAVLREQAEKSARENAARRGVGEVTLDEILAVLISRLPHYVAHGLSFEVLRALELTAERAVLVGVPDILDAVASAREAGKTVVFVSDMYHTREVIHGWLVAAGYPADCAVLVSSESRCTKADGGLWSVLRRHVGEGRAILHVGDNPWSDIDRAREHGLDALPFLAARSVARQGGPLTGDIVPYSLQARYVRLRDRPSALDGVVQGGVSARLAALGRSWGAVVVGAYVRWIAQRAQAIGVRHVFFCARDGWLPIQVWRAWNLSEATGISASYLHVSRRALSFAAAAAVSSPAHLATGAIETLIRRFGRLTIGDLLARNGVRDAGPLSADAEHVFGSLDTVLTPDDDERLRALFRRHPATLYAAIEGELHDAARYLVQEGVGDGPVGFVDVGWNGTLQSAAAHILRYAGKTPRLYGLYCGLWNDAQKHRHGAGWMEAAYGSDFIHDPDQYGLRNAVDIFENLLASEEGTTTGYVQEGDRMIPQRATGEKTRAQFDAIVRPFQAGVLAGLGSVRPGGKTGASGPEGVLDETGLGLAAGAAAMARLSLSPTAQDVEMIGAIQHAADIGHRALEPMVPELTMDDPAAASHDFRFRSWPVGSVLALLQRLEGTAREAVCAAAREQFAHFDARTIGQFQ